MLSPLPLFIIGLVGLIGTLLGAGLAFALLPSRRRINPKAGLSDSQSITTSVASEIDATHDEIREIFSVAKIGIWECDFRTGLVSRSEGHDEIYGYAEARESWTYQDFMDAIHLDDRAWVQALIQECIEKGEDQFSAEFRVVWPDRSVHWLTSRARFLRAADGTAYGARGILMDVTSIKMAQADLAEAKKRAEHASFAKSRFVANVSHELRTPLSAILGFAGLLKNAKLNPGEREEYSRIIERNGAVLVRLIDELLDLSKIEAGRLQFDHAVVDLHQLIDELEVLLRFKAVEKGLAIEFTRDENVPRLIRIDPVRLRQIISNLAGNAIKFTEHGYVKVHLSAARSGDSPVLVCVVEDTGAGIPPDEVHRLFHPFQQIDVSSTRKFGGTGLGLYLSRELAKGLGGDLKLIWTQPKVGTRFEASVLLQTPTAKELEALAAAKRRSLPESASILALEGREILIVDDSRDNQLLMQKLLARHGARSVFADNGERALEFAKARKFDAVLMD